MSMSKKELQDVELIQPQKITSLKKTFFPKKISTHNFKMRFHFFEKHFEKSSVITF